MCGLFGWQFYEPCPDIHTHTLAAVLAHNANRRGDESWGVSIYDGSGTEMQVRKSIGSIKKTCRVVDILGNQVMGHTRKATVGAISFENAHPYHVGKIIGMHNGHVANYSDLNTKYNRTCQVDSMQVFEHLSAGLALDELSGQGTVTYVNTDEPATVLLGRGQHSDLAIYGIGTVEACRGIVWASISVWAQDALEMAGCTEFFTWETAPKNLYATDPAGRTLLEMGDFKLDMKYTSIGVTHYAGNSQGQSYSANFDLVEWRKRNTQQVEQWKGSQHYLEYRKKSLEEMDQNTSKSIESLGVDGPKINPYGSWENTEQCEGCNSWGVGTNDYVSNANGIVHHESIDQWLCYQCSAFWGQQTCDTPLAPEPVYVPELRLQL